MRTERVTVTMPADQAAKLRQAAAGSTISSYVSDAVQQRLDRESALTALDELWGPPSEEGMAWARERLGMTSDATA